jgi:5-methylcytosine-specific restriction protein B
MYKNEQFTIPKNVFIIGMMNTADRSLAILDYALRRRFAFYEIKPAFESKGFKEYQTRLDNPLFNKLISCVKRLNAAIKTDSSLGKGFCIGHSYFCGLTPEGISETSLDAIIEYEIIPLLEEYWFDEPDNVNNWSDQLRNSIR